MKISKFGKQIIKDFEGLRLEAYQCSAGRWTIGYGHTGKNIKQDLVITQKEADNFFDNDIKEFTNCVIEKFGKDWLQHEFDALVSFAYNMGCGGFGKGITTAIKNKDFAKISEKWVQYRNISEYTVKDGKKHRELIFNRGLYYRRLIELKLFTGDCYPEIYHLVKAWARQKSRTL